MSISYQNKWKRKYMKPKIDECKKLLMLAKDLPGLHVDKKLRLKRHEYLWVLATAVVESALDDNVVSSRKARSSMQTYRKYSPCVRCDLRVAGIYHAVRYLREHGACSAAAKYNAGPRGSCMGVGSGYAVKVLNVYERICEEDGTKCPIDWGC